MIVLEKKQLAPLRSPEGWPRTFTCGHPKIGDLAFRSTCGSTLLVDFSDIYVVVVSATATEKHARFCYFCPICHDESVIPFDLVPHSHWGQVPTKRRWLQEKSRSLVEELKPCFEEDGRLPELYHLALEFDHITPEELARLGIGETTDG